VRSKEGQFLKEENVVLKKKTECEREKEGTREGYKPKGATFTGDL
jgi:hypothetical protein